MVSVDTNILVRFLTKDQPEEFQRAYRLLQQGSVFVATTVVLETEWVLRFAYGYSNEQVVAALRDCFGLSSVDLEEPARVAIALDWHERGLDFADALHLAARRSTDAFVSFDKKLVRRASLLTDLVIRLPD